MSHGNGTLARLARPHAERAIERLAAIVESGYEAPGARVAAARVLLELAYGSPGRRPRVKPAAVNPRVVKIDWGDSTM